jgi:hypothetical protein
MACLLGLPVLFSPYILTADGQLAFDRALLRDEECLVMRPKALRAMRRYELGLEGVRSELQSNRELLRSKPDEQRSLPDFIGS